ncbi:MAG TPA: Hsp20/alpha crystallin family protein [Azonexus sp.]
MANDTRDETAVVHKSPAPGGEGAQPGKPALFNPMEEMERLFGRVVGGWMRPMGWNWPVWSAFEGRGEATRAPQLDIIDRDREIVVRVELPGVEKKDISISVNDNTLNIHGTISRRQVERRQDFVRCEIASGNFSRSLPMPAGIDTAAINASLHDGILEVVLPKNPGEQRRAVEVT